MGFLRSTKGSIISDYFKLQEDIAGFSKGYMYDVALYDDHLEITSMQKRKLLLNYDQITDVFYGFETELVEKPKSVIGRAAVGGHFVCRRWCNSWCCIRYRYKNRKGTASVFHYQLHQFRR